MARPRKPTLLKVVGGTAQPCRINKSEPKPKRVKPSPPAHLSDKAKTAWGEASVILDRIGVLTEADAIAMEGLCEAIADLRTARQALASYGGSLTYETVTKDGGKMHRAYPEVAMVSDADRRLAMWLAKFGLTPADRSRVSSGNDDKGKADPWANF